jgi:ankyrin repeat protein
MRKVAKREGAAVPTLYEVVNHSEFMSVYNASDASSIADDLLLRSLANNDSTARIAIASQLLDDGADPAAEDTDGVTTLHVLLGRGIHDFEAEVPLLKRLLDGGADINKVIRKFGTPLETLAAQFKFSDETLAPLYDVLFARDDLDLWQTSLHDRSVYANVQKRVQRRAALVARMDDYLRDR